MHSLPLRHTLSAATLGLLLASTPAYAVGTVYEDGDKVLKLGFLMQPQLQLTQGGATEGGWGIDPYLRRLRILMAGKLNDQVHFFAETDNPNFGKNGDWSGSMFIQDAWVEFNLHEAFKVDAGMLLVPFSHHSMQGAITLLTLDYHGGLVKYPAGKVWRDAGIMVRGELLNRKLAYRLALTNGTENSDLQATEIDPDTGAELIVDHPAGDINPNDLPRMVGRLTFNLFDSDDGPGAGGFFYDGVFLKADGDELISPKKFVCVGAGVDYQGEAILMETTDEDGNLDGSVEDYLGIAADVFVDLPMADPTRALTGQADFYMFDFGEANAANGMGLFADLGFRVNRIQPVLSYELWDYAESDDADMMRFLGGVNWWYLAHNANIKAQLGATLEGEADPAFAAAVQSQFYF